jgi:hypothetical protein
VLVGECGFTEWFGHVARTLGTGNVDATASVNGRYPCHAS